MKASLKARPNTTEIVNTLGKPFEALQDFALQFRDGRLVLKNAKGDTVLRMDTSPIQSITLRDGWLFVDTMNDEHLKYNMDDGELDVEEWWAGSDFISTFFECLADEDVEDEDEGSGQRIVKNFIMPKLGLSLSGALRKLLKEKELLDKPSEVYLRAGVSRQMFHNAMSYKSKAGKRTFVQLAFGIGAACGGDLAVDEVEDLLRAGGYVFSPSDPSDAIFMRCIKDHVFNVFKVNDLLHAHDCPLFEIHGIRRH